MITSTANAQVKNVIDLLKKSAKRKKSGLFVIEGLRMFTEIPKDRIEKIYVSESFFKENGTILNGFAYELVSDNVFTQMSDTKTPQGILALVRMLEYNIEDIISVDMPVVVMLENIQDPGNLGTIMRTAEGAGVTGIIMSKDTVDIYNPKTIRSTMGALFRMPFIYIEDMLEVSDILKKRDIVLVAAHLQGKKKYYAEELNRPMALMIGNEGNGLTDAFTKKADVLVKIPMEGQLESLNAAVSAAIILYEAYRQREKI